MEEEIKTKETIELDELKRLIGKGQTFTIRRVVMVRPGGLFGFLKKRIRKEEELTFEIKEATLATMDRLSAEGIQMVIDDNRLTSKAGNATGEAHKLAHENAIRMAKYVALAVLGEDFTPAIQMPGGRVKYVEDTARLDELTKLFAHAIKPSDLFRLCVTINAIENLPDFTNCIRLVSASRTTIPNLIQ